MRYQQDWSDDVRADDPYNFKIAYGFGFGLKNEEKQKHSSRKGVGGGKLGASRSKQKRLVKSSKSKTITCPRQSPTSLKHQESADSPKDGTPTNDADVMIPASVPAAPASALDKAMGFLEKYKQRALSSPALGHAARMNSTRRWSATDAASDADNETDFSLGSDDIETGLTFYRKIDPMLKPNRVAPTPEPNRSLTDVPPSGRFATAKQLVITESEISNGPKAAVSPIGLEGRLATSDCPCEEVSTRKGHQFDTCPSEEGRKSGLRFFSVSISRSPSSDMVRQDQRSGDNYTSSVESVSSAVTGGFVKEVRAEALCGWSQGSRDDSFSDLARSSKKDAENGSNLTGLELRRGGKISTDSHVAATRAIDGAHERVYVGEGFGKLSSFEDVAVVHDQDQTSKRGQATTAEDTSWDIRNDIGSERNYDHRSARTTQVAEEEEGDCYDDDDFEDVDDSLGSNDHVGDQGLGGCFQQNVTTNEDRHTPVHNTIPLGIDGKEEDSGQRQGDGDVSNRVNEPFGRACRAWDRGANAASPLVATVEDNVRPRVFIRDGNGGANGCEVATTGDLPSVQVRSRTVKEAWGCTLDHEEVLEGVRATHTASMTTSVACQCIVEETSRNHTPGRASFGGTGLVAGVGDMSNQGVQIDRSIETCNPQRPPGADVKIFVRSNAVASVEYAHDPERGVDLRSFGTQAVGSTAAVQANILCPGMLGTNSALDAGLETRRTKTYGVGYRKGEPYAKWGRFTCETSACGLDSRDYPRNQRAAAKSPTETEDYRWASHEKDAKVTEDTNALRVDESTLPENTSGGSKVIEKNNLRISGRSDPFNTGGIPSFLQMLLHVMAKSQADSCVAWTQALKETVGTKSLRTSSERVPVKETGQENELAGEDVDRGWRQSSSAIDADVYGVMVSSQDSFRRQLADMRRNLNEIRYRAEAACCRGSPYKYETLAGAREFVARVRPAATSYTDALMTVDSSLTPEEAVSYGGGSHDDTTWTSPVGPETVVTSAEKSTEL